MTLEHVRVGDVLSLERREVIIDPVTEYRLIGIYSFGKGIFHRDPKLGAELGDFRFFKIEPGDLVLSNIQAWEGAIAFAMGRDTGTIGTHRFLSYVPIDGSIDTDWARWFLLSEPGMELIRRAAPGTTIRNRTLAIDRFEALKIPLPPIDEQRRVAERLDQVWAAARQLKERLDRASSLSRALVVSTASRPDIDNEAKSQAGWRRVRLGSVMTPSQVAVPVEPERSYRNVGIYSFGRGLFRKPDINGMATSAKVLNSIRAGQFIYSRLFAFEGAYACVPAEFDGHCVSNEFPTFDTDQEQLEAKWLANYLRSPERWAELGGASKGLGVRRQRVPVEAVLNYEVSLPPIAVQQALTAIADHIHHSETSRFRSEQRIASLVPAVLNQAFESLS